MFGPWLRHPCGSSNSQYLPYNTSDFLCNNVQNIGKSKLLLGLLENEKSFLV